MFFFFLVGTGQKNQTINLPECCGCVQQDQSEIIIVDMIDPSELLRPERKRVGEEEEMADGKRRSQFRDYSVDEKDPLKERVRETYRLMHRHQTVDFVKEKRAKWLQFNTLEATVRSALEKLNGLIDSSDPDIDLPNIVHAFQAAERARNDYPDLDWLHLTALIHDLGKIMAFYDEPQWAVVGDTFPVGCAWADSIVYRESSFAGNPDALDSRYNTLYGIYQPNCGIDNLLMSWGHDEYLYQVLSHNHRCKLPSIALKIIRFHSFYPWHQANDYQHLTDSRIDDETKRWVQIFK